MALRDMVRRAFKNPDDEEDAKVIEETDRIIQFLRESRKRLEYEWFINDVYYRNEQYLKYNVGARRVQTIPVEKMLDRVVINKVKQQVRGVVNFLNAEHPTIGVRPGDEADDAYLRAKKEKHLADYWYRHLKLNAKAKKISLDAAKYGIGWAKVLWDADALAPTKPFTDDNGNQKEHTYGEVFVDRCDPFEVYFDPMAQSMGDMRYIAHAPTRTVGEIKANPLYKNTDKVKPDPRLSSSILRQSQLRLTMSNAAATNMLQPNQADTTIVWEIFRKRYNPATKRWETWVTTRTEDGVLLRNEQWVMDEFPFVPFTTDIAGLLAESKGVIHDIREPNRALNEGISQVHETMRIMGHLNWLIPRGSNVNVITDETGQFIEYDVTPGGTPRQAEAINLPTYINQHLQMLYQFIEDVSGMHAAFNGKAPFAQASGDLVESLSVGDQNNLTSMRDNYDDFFVALFKLLFRTAKKNYQTTRSFPTTETDAFGEDNWEEIKPADISIADDLAISTGTQMPYSIAQKQQMYMNLWKEKAIQDPKLLFKLLEMPDIDAALGDDESDIERQLDEIRTIIAGRKVADPQIFEDHSVHIATIDKFGRGKRWAKLTRNQQQRILDHRQQHVALSIQLAQIAASMQMEPIKRSETVMLRLNSMSDTTPIERTAFWSKFGVNSDASEIQLRGGLFLQDPAQAEQQAMAEDTEMMDMRAVHVSFADNHIVHLQTHGPMLDALLKAQKAQQSGMAPPGAQQVSDVVIKLFQQHIKDHTQAMLATQPSPGLVPNPQSNTPNPPTLKDVGPANQMPQEDTNIGERGKLTAHSPAITTADQQHQPSQPPQGPPQAPQPALALRKTNKQNKLRKKPQGGQ